MDSFTLLVSFLILIAVKNIAEVNSYVLAEGRDIENLIFNFQQINRRIVEKVPSEDLEETMKEAHRWLDELTYSYQNTALKEALKLFTSLPKTEDDSSNQRCSDENFKILYDNTRATGGRARFAMDEDEVPRRIDEIVYHYAMNHAKYCHDIYLKEIEEKQSRQRELLGERKIEILQAYAEELLKQNKYISGVCKKPEQAEITHKALLKLAEQDPDRKYLLPVVDKGLGEAKVEKEKLLLLVQKHLVDPCKKYLNEMPTVREATEFALKWYSDGSEREERFNKMLILSEVCQVAVESFEDKIKLGFNEFELFNYVNGLKKSSKKKKFDF